MPTKKPYFSADVYLNSDKVKTVECTTPEFHTLQGSVFYGRREIEVDSVRYTVEVKVTRESN